MVAFWNRYFFPVTPPAALAAFRIVFYFSALLHAVVHHSLHYLGYPSYLFEARGFFHLFPYPQPGAETMNWLYAIFYLVLALSAVGAGTTARLSASLLAFYLYGIRYNYGFMFKSEGLVTVCLGVMVFAKCDEAFSLRNLLWASRRPAQEKLTDWTAQGFFAWPLQFFRVYWAGMLFSAAAFKLKDTGWQWAYGDALQQVFLRQMYYFYPQSNPPTGLARFFLDHPGLTLVGSWLSLLVELLAPLILLGGRIRLVILAIFLVMLIMVRLTMGHSFVFSHLPLCLALLPWEQLGTRLAAPQPGLDKHAR